MIIIAFTIWIFLEIISYIVIADVILSWLTIFGVNFRPVFIASILDPIYDFVKKYIPTSIGPIDLTPIIIIIIIRFLKGLVVGIFPEALEYLKMIN